MGQVDDLTLVRRYSPTVIHFRLLWDTNSAALNHQYAAPQPMDDRMLKALWPIPDTYVQPPVLIFVPPELDPSYRPYCLRAHILSDCNGDGLIRIIVSDGLHTTYQDVGGLSIRG